MIVQLFVILDLQCQLKKNGTSLLSCTEPPGGNTSHLSPEVLNSYKDQKDKGKREIEISYLKQPSLVWSDLL